MIPILYESNETQFQSNGIGRLTDCISCKVSEERNGIYECEFEYPVDGHRYEDIVEGRIIAVKHDDTDDIQPFDIYGHSAPIDGIVTFYAHHISYRLGEITVKPFSASSCTETFEKLKQNSLYANPFTFWTDKSVNADFEIETPVNLKEYLGGTEGSILDVFGTGEYEFDKWIVKFHLNRGTDTNVQIRYGKNLADLQDEEDWSGCYTSVVPYWFGQDQETDEDVLVTLDNWILSSGQSTYGGREIIVPMDLSGEWQDPPTKAQLQQTATQRLMLGEGWMPSKSVKVDFVHLWQTEEYKEYAPLQRVKLCDTVTVIYPKLGMEFTKKVVSVKYDALLERYDEITLGESTTSFGNLISTETAKQVANAKLYLRKIIKNTNYALQQNMEDEIQHVTDLITGGQGGYAVWGFNANGYPEELFFLDHPSVETAVNVLRINKNGIGFSTSGVNGTYRTAWTIDGHFVADFITSGVLTANVIRSGLLSDMVGNNYWNLDTGEFQLSWTGTKVGNDSLGTTVNKATRAILNNANAYGLGWKVNHNSFTAESNGECWYHGYAEDGTPANIDGWVYWNGEQVTIPRGYGINPNDTMPFDTVLYSVFRTSDSKYHDVVWTGTQWEGNTYTASSGTNWTPSARAVWTWNEDTDIILASYLLPSAEGAIYGAQLFTPPKKYSELAEKAEYTLSQQLNDFATQVTEDIEDIQAQLDGVVDNWFYDYEPTLDNYPASDWTTDELKQDHVGDMFYDMSTGRAYRFLKYGTENLIEEPYYDTSPRTSNGITWVNNGDGTVTANGTATATSYFTFHHRTQGVLDGLKAGKTYRLSLDVKTGRCSIYFAHYSGSTNLGEVALRDVNNAYYEKEFTAWTDEYDGNTIALYIGSAYGTQTNTIITPVLVEKWVWQLVPDTDATLAMQLASEAKDTADHKRRVFVVQPYVPYDQGDIWMQGTDGDILVCLTAKTSSQSYSLADWGKLNKYTDEATTLNIVDGQIADIRVGGRNLLLKTGESKSVSNAITAGSFTTFDAYNMVLPYNELGLTTDDSVTLSFDWKAENIPSGTITVRVGTNTSPYEYFGTFATITSSTNSGHFEKTYKVTSALASSTGSRLRFRIDSSVAITSGTFKFTVSNAKLEIGTKATDFTVAPEDVDADITDVYVKSGGRNYMTGTSVPFKYFIKYADGNSTFATHYATYHHQLLSELGFVVGDKITISYDWLVSGMATYGTFRLELYGTTSSSNYAYVANTGIITPSASNKSGHAEFTIDVTEAILNGYKLVFRIDNSEGTVTISNLMFEKGETATRWSSAPEDVSIPSQGLNMLRGTNIGSAIATGGWDAGKWRSAGSGSGTRTVISVDDALVPNIKHGWSVTSETYAVSEGSAVLIGQNSIPNIQTGHTYVLSCYAKGTGVLNALAGVSGFKNGGIIYVQNVTEWTRYSFPLTIPNYSAYYNPSNRKTNVFFGITGTNATLQICGIKFEEGLTATDWSYADEDIIDEISDLAEDLKTQIDGKIETFYQSADPSTAWTTTALKTEHTGDLWYKTTDHSTWRWTGTAWQEQMASDTVFDKIDGKSTIYYGTTSGSYPDAEVGDYLVDSTDGSTYKRTSSGWTKVTDYATAVSTAVTDYDSGLNQESVFNKLTNNGQTQGIYLQNGKLYLNATYMQIGKISSANGLVYFDLDNSEIHCDRLVSTSSYSSLQKTSADIQSEELGSSTYYLYGLKVYNSSYPETGYIMIAPRTGSGAYVQIPCISTQDSNGLEISYGGRSASSAHTGGFLRIEKDSFDLYADYTRSGSSTTYLAGISADSSNGRTNIQGEKVYVNGNDGTSSSVRLTNTTVQGTLTVVSAKSRLVQTDDYSDRLLYCYETTSPMFGDIGEGKIGEDGACYVWIDPIFSKTVTLDKYQVFLQKYGKGDCYVSERTSSYFVVSGTVGMSFGWEIKAKQYDLDQLRCEVNRNDTAPNKDTENYGELSASYISELKEGRMNDENSN